MENDIFEIFGTYEIDKLNHADLTDEAIFLCKIYYDVKAAFFNYFTDQQEAFDFFESIISSKDIRRNLAEIHSSKAGFLIDSFSNEYLKVLAKSCFCYACDYFFIMRDYKQLKYEENDLNSDLKAIKISFEIQKGQMLKLFERAKISMMESLDLRQIIKSTADGTAFLRTYERLDKKRIEQNLCECQSIPEKTDLVFQVNHPDHAPDLAIAVKLWLDLYGRDEKTKHSHSHGADLFLEKQHIQTTAKARIKEITSPIKNWNKQRRKAFDEAQK